MHSRRSKKVAGLSKIQAKVPTLGERCVVLIEILLVLAITNGVPLEFGARQNHQKITLRI